MFNESINFNISYGRIGANQEDVEKVAALADIHSKVLMLLARMSRSNNFVQVASRTSLTVCLFRLCRYPMVTKPRLGSVGSKSVVERSREWQLQELFSGSNNLEC